MPWSILQGCLIAYLSGFNYVDAGENRVHLYCFNVVINVVFLSGTTELHFSKKAAKWMWMADIE